MDKKVSSPPARKYLAGIFVYICNIKDITPEKDHFSERPYITDKKGMDKKVGSPQGNALREFLYIFVISMV